MILAILQARMASRRMPGKALAALAGQPMILRQIERLRAARTLSRIVVATSVEATDDPLAAFLVSRGQTVFRGAPVDLLGRFARCAESVGGVSHVVRIKGDAPFVDPAIVDKAVRIALDSDADYVANRGWFGFPKGMEVEVIRAPVLVAAARADRDPAARASPTAFLRADPVRFRHANFAAPRDLSALDWRVKTQADMTFARGVYAALHGADPAFAMRDVLDLTGGRQDVAKYAA
ncbi:MAG: NTP transferase domain-containing protein [Caulobacter sp.]|nr:NTP transferase domain-containing protein [Caulobacter sp.]